MISRKKLEEDLSFYIASTLILAVLFVATLVLFVATAVKDPEIVVMNFTETLDVINANCDSAFLTHILGEEDWYVFRQICNEENYCKTIYTSVEDCLK